MSESQFWPGVGCSVAETEDRIQGDAGDHGAPDDRHGRDDGGPLGLGNGRGVDERGNLQHEAALVRLALVPVGASSPARHPSPDRKGRPGSVGADGAKQGTEARPVGAGLGSPEQGRSHHPRPHAHGGAFSIEPDAPGVHARGSGRRSGGRGGGEEQRDRGAGGAAFLVSVAASFLVGQNPFSLQFLASQPYAARSRFQCQRHPVKTTQWSYEHDDEGIIVCLWWKNRPKI
mmetsp:Transcript_3976/g.7604  ORF Transcript_3976/g.7604 Transcript_3976/m.7604 type:complete len:231 (-) Transcript_3976:575-1267(-)